MKSTKRIISTALCIIILSLSPMAFYLDASSVPVVHASGPVTLTFEIIQAICAYFGSVVLAYSPIERPGLPTDEEIMRVGYDFLNTAGDMISSGVNEMKEDFGACVVLVDTLGQTYVLGTEALKEAAGTKFELIMGGKDPDDDGDGDDSDDDDDNNDNIVSFPNKIKGWGIGLNLTFANYVAKLIEEQYGDFINGEPSIYDSMFAALAEQAFTGYESIRNEDGSYSVTGYSCSVSHNPFYEYVYEDTSLYKPFGHIGSDGDIYLETFYGNSYKTYNCSYKMYENGVLRGNYTSFLIHGNEYYANASINIPIFPSVEAALVARSAGDYTSALNYAKVYREADWLAEDWAGKLIDPLTGLNALSSFSNIARHQGLNALADELAPDDFVDYLRDYFAHLGTDVLPEVDPSLAPIVYPSTLPEFTLDPARNPVIQPVVVPNPDPNPNPNPGTDPNPNPNPNPNPGIDPNPGKDPVEEIDLDGELPAMPSTFLPLAEQMQYKFPFSIPWDVKYLFDKLASQGREPPRWVFPVVVESIGLHKELVIDLSRFQAVSDLSRMFLTLLFCLSLINMTIKVVGMRKEE